MTRLRVSFTIETDVQPLDGALKALNGLKTNHIRTKTVRPDLRRIYGNSPHVIRPKSRKHPYNLSFSYLKLLFLYGDHNSLNYWFPIDPSQFLE